METLIDEYYEYREGAITFPQHKAIVFDILADMTDRSGLGDEWDQIDGEIQEEILETWLNIAQKHLNEK